MADTRLIERWLPIAEIGIESTRERTPMTPFPAPNRLHVWWARRPLVASRAAVLASLLPADADRDRFLHVLGIHGDPVAAKRRIAAANRTGERLGADAYGYPRAFGYIPDDVDRIWLHENAVRNAVVLDPTVGGGSVPFESVRVGLHTVANDLNPVAALIERATIEWPARFGASPRGAVEDLGERSSAEVRERLAGVFPEETGEHTRPDGYLWVRTVACPYRDGIDRTGRAARASRSDAIGHTGHAAPASHGGPGEHGDGIEAPRRSAPTSGPSPGATWSAGRAGPSPEDLPPLPPPVTVTCKPGDSLDHLGDASIDLVVMDPPCYDNVMYAELSDFFYVWLKRTAGHVFPELFRRQLTDRENQAVANPAKYRGEKGARALAGQDYQERMAAIFAECRRVLKPDGIMTLMFTHKATGAWDALTKGLMESGFVITASWPINTEAEGSLHIKDKASANSTVFLVCRPRAEGRSGGRRRRRAGAGRRPGERRSLPGTDGAAPRFPRPPHRPERSRTGRRQDAAPAPLQAARDLLAETQADRDPRFDAALEAVLEVLPVSGAFTGIEVGGEAGASANDFEALYGLYRLAYRDRIDEPEQLRIELGPDRNA